MCQSVRFTRAGGTIVEHIKKQGLLKKQVEYQKQAQPPCHFSRKVPNSFNTRVLSYGRKVHAGWYKMVEEQLLHF